ncbi:hypothetical protein BDW59DRAFT_162571 [Aspergillus cavernicola]|uniref:Macro domain-containing protein n=1 Tax=Aspergillus cavernicola TaxID=176166 RepID=A0ABR4I914_9EURO
MAPKAPKATKAAKAGEVEKVPKAPKAAKVTKLHKPGKAAKVVKRTVKKADPVKEPSAAARGRGGAAGGRKDTRTAAAIRAAELEQEVKSHEILRRWANLPEDEGTFLTKLANACHPADHLIEVGYPAGPGITPTFNAKGAPKKRAAVAIAFAAMFTADEERRVIQVCAVDVLTKTELCDIVLEPGPKRLVTAAGGWEGDDELHYLARHQGGDSKTKSDALSLLHEFIDQDTILVGHDMRVDMEEMDIVPGRIVDTNLLTRHAVAHQTGDGECMGMWGVRELCEELANTAFPVVHGKLPCIQEAFAAREVLLTCLLDKKWLSGWALKNKNDPRVLYGYSSIPERKLMPESEESDDDGNDGNVGQAAGGRISDVIDAQALGKLKQEMLDATTNVAMEKHATKKRKFIELEKHHCLATNYDNHHPNNVKHTLKSINKKIFLLQGDIITMPVACIVNAANSPLIGGAGVNGAVWAKIGSQLETEFSRLRPRNCRVGEALTTEGYGLYDKIIHTVAPRYSANAATDQAQELRQCYRNCLSEAKEHGQRTIAFCTLGAGIFRYPKREAVEIAVEEVSRFLQNVVNEVSFDKIIFCTWDEETSKYFIESLIEHFHVQ